MRAIFLAVLVVLWTGSLASAGSISFFGDSSNSTERLGSFAGSVSYKPLDSILSITLTNTTDRELGGYITGFLFNLPDGVQGVFDRDPQYSFLQTAAGEKGAPFGTYDLGAALAAKEKSLETVYGSFEGGGDPTRGLSVGQTAIFNFIIRGENPAKLSSGDFLPHIGQAGGVPDLLVRFKGFNNGGSDKVVAQQSPPTDVVHNVVPPVPLPAAVWSGLAGLGGMLIWRRMRRQ